MIVKFLALAKLFAIAGCSLHYLTIPSWTVPYESSILVQLLDLVSLAKINLFESGFKSYDPWVMANYLP